MPLYNVTLGYRSPTWRTQLGKMMRMTVTEARAHWASLGYAPENLTVEGGPWPEGAVTVVGYRIPEGLIGSGPCETCDPVSAILSVAATVHERWTWEGATEQENIAHPAEPGAHAFGPTVGGVGANARFTPGAGGTSYSALSPSAVSGQVLCTAGTAYHFDLYSYGYGDAYPVTDHGMTYWAVDLDWYDATPVVIQTDELQAPITAPEAYPGETFAHTVKTLTAPVGAVSFQIATRSGGGLRGAFYDEVTITAVAALPAQVDGPPPERILTCAEWDGLLEGTLPSGVEIVG